VVVAKLGGMALIGIYLQDHLALSSAGIRLARRCRRENAAEGELARFLDRLIPELEQDRAVLVEVATALGTKRDVLKEAAVAVGDLVGRLKLNGHLLTYSNLSRLWELEALIAGTSSRLSAWRILAKLQPREASLHGFAFEAALDRALMQREELERLHLKAAEVAFKSRMRIVERAETARGA
jgi:hypothetical protein